MFIEVVTKREEFVSLNINRISLFVSNNNDYTVIWMIDGEQFVICENYTEFKMRLRQKFLSVLNNV